MDEDLNVSESVADEVVSKEPEIVESNEPESMLEAIQEGLKPEEDKQEEPAKEEQAAEEEKPEAEVTPDNDDEPPEGISKKAQERFRSMVTKVKEKDAEIERLSSDLGGIRKVMQDTGGKPEDFAKTFEYIKALNSGDFQYARTILEEQVRQLSVLTGKPFGEVDPLSQFPDLRERVNSYQMDEQTALEMARHRSTQQAQDNAYQQMRQQQESQQAFTQVRQQAISDIDRLGTEWAKTDPDYKFKEQIINERAKEIAAQFPPQQWAAQVKLIYQTLSSVPMQKPAPHQPNPLRSSGQSAGNRQPNSILEAVQNGLGYSS